MFFNIGLMLVPVNFAVLLIQLHRYIHIERDGRRGRQTQRIYLAGSETRSKAVNFYTITSSMNYKIKFSHIANMR